MKTELEKVEMCRYLPIKHRLNGRHIIYSSYPEVNRTNVIDALGEALAVHIINREKIEYLFNYYRGFQPIISRVKEARPDIIHNTVVNHAEEIVEFKTSYLLSNDVTYISRNLSDGVQDKVNRLNDLMEDADRPTADKEIADDFTISGTAFRFVYPRADYEGDEEEAPFEVHTLDPHCTFVAYRKSNKRNAEPVFGVTYVSAGVPEVTTYDLYTKSTHYKISDGEIKLEEPNMLGDIPIVEYMNNAFRIGAFEPVLDLLDGINVLESNRLEATEQNVQALTWFNDVDLDDEDVEALKSRPASFIFTRTIKDAVSPSIKAVAVDLQQQDQQVLQNDLYKKVLTIVGMPSVSDGNTSDSSNNGAVVVKNGWTHAEARAKDTERLWKRSDKRFLRLVLKICQELIPGGFDLKATDVSLKFMRRNYEDIATKANVLTTLLGCDKVSPQVAYQVSNIAPDPEEACKAGLEWYEEQKKEEREALESGNRIPAEGSTGQDQRRADRREYNRNQSRERQAGGRTSGTSH